MSIGGKCKVRPVLVRYLMQVIDSTMTVSRVAQRLGTYSCESSRSSSIFVSNWVLVQAFTTAQNLTEMSILYFDSMFRSMCLQQ